MSITESGLELSGGATVADETRRSLTAGQLGLLALLVVVNLVLWVLPSDVVELVARDRQTLLGRYSRRHFTWIVVTFLVSLTVIYLQCAPTALGKKRRIFGLVAGLLAVIIPLVALDFYLRATKDWGYVLGTMAYHRTPDDQFTGVFEDRPAAHRSFNQVPAGFGEVPWTLTTDRRGYRNAVSSAGATYDVVLLGDSFVEGSKVSDDQYWPVRLQEQSGWSVYQLGMSGYAPQHSLAALAAHGESLQPRTVVFLLYEGNDFRRANPKARVPSIWGSFFKRSPIIEALDESLVKLLGPIGARTSRADLEVLSWMPVEVAGDAASTYYAFSPSDLMQLHVTTESFIDHKYWRRTQAVLDQLRQQCAALDTELALVYAPVKPHVVLPAATSAIPAEQLRAFADLRAKSDLPAPPQFKQEVWAGLLVKEAATRDWCRANDVPFFSLTEALRDAMAAGRQVYYTYDEHWTPVGHEVVARAVHGFLADRHPAVAADPGPAS